MEAVLGRGRWLEGALPTPWYLPVIQGHAASLQPGPARSVGIGGRGLGSASYRPARVPACPACCLSRVARQTHTQAARSKSVGSIGAH